MVDRVQTEVTRAWKPPIAGIREVFHASFSTHAYPPHTHDVWTVFIVDAGAIRYDLHGRRHHAGPARVTVLPPHVVHDGRAATEAGFRKRVLYLETSILGEELAGSAVDRPVVPDPALPSAVAALHDVLMCVDDALEAETRLAFVTERLAESLGAPKRGDDGDSGGELADALRAHLDRQLFESVTLGGAASTIGASPTQLARAFSRSFGIAPHAYVIGRRLEAARDRLLAGQDIAEVAAETGFCDQAHLTRRFKRFLGTTPGQFQAGPRRASASPGPVRRPEPRLP